MTTDQDLVRTLSAVSTATITTILLKKGLRNVCLRDCRPLRPGSPRVVGAAFTLRFIPMREDLATPESWSSPRSTRAAIEAMPEGCVAVVDAMGITDAGIYGDILCAPHEKTRGCSPGYRWSCSRRCRSVGHGLTRLVSGRCGPTFRGE